MTDELDTLRPEVREALIDFDSWMGSFEYADGELPRERFCIIRAELLRLAEDAAMFAHAVSLGQRYKQHAERAEAELAEMKQSFDLRWKADMCAIDHWRREHPGDDLTWPDHADLCVWLMGELAALKARIAEAPVGVVNVDDRGCEFVSVDFAENTRVRLVVEE